ncbi:MULTISPECIES: hypothetical protein [unclassified Microbacterium]|uniref:hypothetical protein n=1 Tax=unclassified Microbacterium TaxID=2609290 RepID=UPI00344A95A2
MSKQTSHADAARAMLATVASTATEATGDAEVRIVLREAQVHATLALVEQQRIANLITLGQFRVAPDDVAHFRHIVAQPKDDYTLQVSPQIAEALGLS